MNDNPVTIQFALISHTNNGKTTLARTLVGMDVGEVRDAAHVTVLAESHTLLRTEQGDVLELWDTPGFGDSVRLLRRLAMAGNPIGWFLREVFDRYRDKPFWLSQQALRTAKESADVVLYLVNSSESPRDAGYLPAEMKILEWLGKPVVVLLNQLGRPRPAAEEQAEQARWQEHLDQYGIVRSVLAMDAFARCWVHERVFYEAIGKLLEPDSQAGYARLLAVWQANNQQRFAESMQASAELLAAAAGDRQSVAAGADPTFLQSAMKAVGLSGASQQKVNEKAMAELVERLNVQIGETTRRILKLYQLDPGDAPKINARLRDNFKVNAPVNKAQAGLLGAIVSGAATGLSADLAAGGLTFGAGALLGGIVGALTMAGAAWGFNTRTERNQTTVAFADEFLQTLLVATVLRYLAVAHFGRGRGNFVEGEAPAFWQTEVEAAVALHGAGLPALWQQLRQGDDKAVFQLEDVLTRVTSLTLAKLYPGVLL
ncbi:DUF3482 domain-containing protein [Massilia sp. PAMC28688]|uniref:DUF3482 domain-containing protein n=1 Tax=Massilia sp. PAMC28688 TaxID=2861283 RepID=UPI001C6318E0|nr:DUF3482 domain-containing protein [Massilia sp. PAMC28688]QYF94586.1 DUF3482 domain-containing protein [Massilia sp. PAMC28688]